MKHALVFEKDSASCTKTSRLLSWLGYATASVQTPCQALNAAKAIKFDVIVSCTAEKPNDRRSLTGELKRTAPQAAVVLIAENDPVKEEPSTQYYAGVSAVIKRPVSVEVLRRIVEFGIDGCGLQPVDVSVSQERRKKQL
jgi:CheY-like chemotaxis protein